MTQCQSGLYNEFDVSQNCEAVSEKNKENEKKKTTNAIEDVKKWNPYALLKRL